MNYKGKRVKHRSTTEIKRFRQRLWGIATGLTLIAVCVCAGIGLGRWVL